MAKCKPDETGNHIEDMLLWTWQSKDFSLLDENCEVESLQYSCYLKNIPDENEREKHKSAYKMILQETKNLA